MYCIYTDLDVKPDNGNYDHVIPLSLGGHNQFCVWSDRDFNSKVGEKVDGAIANDPLIMFARRDAAARGHSGTDPIPIWKKSEFEGRPIQVSFEKEKLKVWDSRNRTYLLEEEISGKQFKSNFKIDQFAPLRLAAKVSLGGAYFVYGDLIRNAIDCDKLRKLINLDVAEAKADPVIIPHDIVVCDRYHPDTQTNSEAKMFKMLCEFTKRSTFICVPHENHISFHVGVIGVFLSSIICPAQTSQLPKEGLHALGHAVLLGPGTIERLSFRQLAGRLWTFNTGDQPPAPQV